MDILLGLDACFQIVCGAVGERQRIGGVGQEETYAYNLQQGRPWFAYDDTPCSTLAGALARKCDTNSAAGASFGCEAGKTTLRAFSRHCIGHAKRDQRPPAATSSRTAHSITSEMPEPAPNRRV